MPYKSAAQQRYFHAAMAKGKIKPSVVAEFDKASAGIALPEKIQRPGSGRFAKLKEYVRKKY